jgi:hypothetical protein
MIALSAVTAVVEKGARPPAMVAAVAALGVLGVLSGARLRRAVASA